MKQFGPVTKHWTDKSAVTPLVDFSKIRKIAEEKYGKAGGTMTAPAAQWTVVAFAAENRARKLLKKRKITWKAFTKMVLEHDKTLLVGNECMKAALKYLQTTCITPPSPLRATVE